MYEALHLYAGLLFFEVDKEYKLTEDWKDVKELVICGLGKVAHDNLQFFKNNFNIVCIIDGDKEKRDILYRNIKIKHISEAKGSDKF